MEPAFVGHCFTILHINMERANEFLAGVLIEHNKDVPISARLYFDNRGVNLMCETLDTYAKLKAIELLHKLRSDVINNHYAQITNVNLDDWIEKNY